MLYNRLHYLNIEQSYLQVLRRAKIRESSATEYCILNIYSLYRKYQIYGTNYIYINESRSL